MSDNSEQDMSVTNHAMFVVWGQYTHSLGLPQAFAEVPLFQKTVKHSPQSKVLEFLVAHLAGLEHLKDLSYSVHLLDKYQAVARAWGQGSWVDSSGVSRTLKSLREAEVAQYAVPIRGPR